MTKVQQMGEQTNKVATYSVDGMDITLTPQIVKDVICNGANVDDNEVIKFMYLCQANKLNPFTKEVYLVPFGGKAQMTISKEAYYKRAEAHPQYDGTDAGLIVLRNGEIRELEGMFSLPSDQIVGAWAKVYRKDRPRPTYVSVSLKEYDQGNAMWKQKAGTMICKVAKVQALREAFPTLVSGMYTEEELSREDLANKEERANTQTISSAVDADVDVAIAEIGATESVKEMTIVFKSLPEEIRKNNNLIAFCSKHKEKLLSSEVVEAVIVENVESEPVQETLL